MGRNLVKGSEIEILIKVGNIFLVFVFLLEMLKAAFPKKSGKSFEFLIKLIIFFDETTT